MASKSTLSKQTIELLGIKERDYLVYKTLLTLGSAPLRRIAEEAHLNRGTTYDAIKRLQQAGLIRFVDSSARRHFMPEDPQKLRGLLTRREVAIQEARQKVTEHIPHLQDLLGSAGEEPSVRYYEGREGVRDLLRDVLSHTKKQSSKTYRVYSSAGIRDLIAAAMPRYNVLRKQAKVKVKAIAIGEGGTTHGLDERKWLRTDSAAPSYIFVYGRKTAYVAASEKGELFGAVIDDKAISTTQRMIFDSLWTIL
ncbi:MAG: hypothetical protein O3B64_02565 [bacterium]|nr:hypothetical protein [bacterium]MDA1024590.1 hypothetical protein [bacterium]